jgi:PqqD family protein of HPr-rel-A system
MTQRSVTRWRAAHGALIWREWEGQLVVRNARSGSTHLLSPSGTTVLLALIRAGCGMDVSELALQHFGVKSIDSEEGVGLVAVLEKLEELGLVEPAAA